MCVCDCVCEHVCMYIYVPMCLAIGAQDPLDDMWQQITDLDHLFSIAGRYYKRYDAFFSFVLALPPSECLPRTPPSPFSV
jgi:hypothetical protein